MESECLKCGSSDIEKETYVMTEYGLFKRAVLFDTNICQACGYVLGTYKRVRYKNSYYDK